MNSVYYKFVGSTENMLPLTIANPYKHLLIYNYSETDVIIYNESKELAFVPGNSSITLLDVFHNNLYIVSVNLYFKTVPENQNVEIHLINYGL